MFTMRLRTVAIAKHPNVRKAKRWQVCYRDGNSKRKSRFFASRAEAETYADARRTELLNFGVRALTLPDSVRRDAQQALELLQPYGKTILEAVGFYTAYLERTAKSCRTEELLENFLWAKEGEKVSPRHLADLRSRLGRFCNAFKGRMVNSIEPSEIADWIRSLPVGSQTQHNHRRVIHNLFNYALLRKFVSQNPVKDTPLIRVKDTEVEIYTPEEMALLLEHADPRIMPYLTLGAFAGLRCAELERLQWQHVDFQTGYIRVGGDIAKTRSKRLIPILENLRQWLMPYAKPQGNILPVELQNTFRDLIHRACQQAGIKKKNNGLRHSFATYRMAQTGDSAKTALEMGNSPGVIFKHYRELVTQEQASAYWNIRPTVEPNVIPMTAAA